MFDYHRRFGKRGLLTLLVLSLCFGTGAYTAPAQAGTEICNGLDDDADGKVDENFGDLDHDGQAGCVDADDDGDGIPDSADRDDDNDGVLDAQDVDDDGDGLAEQETCDGKDNDQDGLIDEGFADLDLDGQKNCVDSDDDGDTLADNLDRDDDNDGLLDSSDVDDDNDGRIEVELCNGIDDNHNGRTDEGFPNKDGDGLANCVDADIDGDGAANGEDDDADGDGLGDAEDSDDNGDGKAEAELCNGTDDDHDGLEDESCADSDHDGANNGVDTDDDNDGVADMLDPDDDNDGLDDAIDSDDDGDGVTDVVDLDSDDDGVDDVADSDDDNDGYPDSVEAVAVSNPMNPAGGPVYLKRTVLDILGDGLVSIEGLTYGLAYGGQPRVVALATDSSGSQALFFIDMNTGSWQDVVPLGGAGYTAVSSDTGYRFYLLNRAAKAVSMIDLDGSGALAVLPVSGLVDPQGLGYDGRLLVTDNNAGQPLIRFLDPLTGMELATDGLEAPSVDLETVDGMLLSVRPDGGVYVLDTSPCNYPSNSDEIGICAIMPDQWLFSLSGPGGLATDGVHIFSVNANLPPLGAMAASVGAASALSIAVRAPVSSTAPDLVVSAVAPNAPTVDAGKALMVSSTVRNQGQSASFGFTVAFRLSSNNIIGDADDVLLPTLRTVGMGLAAGVASSANTSLMIPKTVAAGSYHVCAMADPGNAVSELDESNNSRCSDAPVTVVSLPDLVVASVSGRPALGINNPNILIRATVRNGGTAPAGAFAVSYALSADKLYDAADLPLCERTVSSLAAGASGMADATCDLPAGIAAGAYYLVARADAANAVLEKLESNNDKSSMSPIQIRPDLAPSSAMFTLSGSSLTVTDTVKNGGVLEAGPFEEGIMARLMTTDGTVAPATRLCGRPLPGLGAGLSSTGSTICDISGLPSGDYLLFVLSDVGMVVAESNESNNRRDIRGTMSWRR